MGNKVKDVENALVPSPHMDNIFLSKFNMTLPRNMHIPYSGICPMILTLLIISGLLTPKLKDD